MSRPHPSRLATAAAVAATLTVMLACRDGTSPADPVVARVAVSALPDSVGAGDTLRLTAVALDAAGAALPRVAVRWRSLHPGFATIDSVTGHVTAGFAGDAELVATVSARGGEVADTVVLRVRSLPRRVLLGGAPDSLLVGTPDTLTVEVRDGAGVAVRRAVTWSSSDTSVVQVDSLGVVRAVERGGAWIRASVGDRADSVLVRADYREVMPGRFYVDVGTGSTSYPTCAVTAGGAVWCGGSQIRGSAMMRTVEGGQSQSCGLADDATLYCWGQDANRVFGTVASTGSVVHDTLYPGGLRMRWRQFTLGDHQQACGIAAADSVVYCWGHNDTKQVGRGPASGIDSLVAPFATPLRAKQVDLGALHGCAIALDDAVWCWGSTASYGVTSGMPGADGLPSRVHPPGSFVQVSTGEAFTCARTRLGETSCWGLLDRSGGGRPTAMPVPLAGGARYAEIFTGLTSRACGITAERALHCWNVLDAVMTPRVVMPGRRFVTVALGARSCALSTEGKIYCF